MSIIRAFLATVGTAWIATVMPSASASPALPLVIAQSTRTERVKLAVLDFDFTSISNPSLLSAVPGASRGVSEMMVNRLVTAGKYSIIERSQLDAVLREQNLGTSGRVETSSAAAVGRILGVDLIMIGSVTRFDVQARNSAVAVPIPIFGGIAVGSSDSDANVQLNVRLVNTSTGEIMATAEGTGNSSQSDSTVITGFGGGGSATNVTEKLLALATSQAIDDVLTQLDSNTKLQTVSPTVPKETALIADLSLLSMVLNRGSDAGYRVGLKLSVEKVVREVKDPATGEVLRTVTEPVGEVQITEVDAKSSVAKILSGTRFAVGDLVKPLGY